MSEADARTYTRDEVDLLLRDADDRAFARGQLEMLTRFLAIWGQVIEHMTSQVDFAYRDGRRAEREARDEDLDALAHQDGVTREMEKFVHGLKQVGDSLMANPPDAPHPKEGPHQA